MTPRLIVIAGPTATGKSSLGVALAQRFGGEVVNADSQQVYRGLDIGTGKPTIEERGGIPHHLFDIADPWEQLNAARFIAEAEQVITAIAQRRRQVFVIGGTGLWLRALIRGLVDAPGKDEAIRARLEAEVAAGALPRLLERLREVDPDTASSIQGPNRVRIIRALEVYELTGIPLSAYHERHRSQPPRYEALTLGLDLAREQLDERINRRVRTMFASGLIEETRRALSDPRARARLELVMGYREALRHLEGALPLEEAIHLAAQAQRQYSRRQRNWFQSERQWRWLTHERAFDEAATACEAWLAREGTDAE